MVDATSRRKQLDICAAAADPIAAAKRDFVAPGLGALQTIPIAAVILKVSPLEIALEPVCWCFAVIDPTDLRERLPHYHFAVPGYGSAHTATVFLVLGK